MTKVWNVRLSDEDKERLAQIAAKLETNRADALRKAIRKVHAMVVKDGAHA